MISGPIVTAEMAEIKTGDDSRGSGIQNFPPVSRGFPSCQVLVRFALGVHMCWLNATDQGQGQAYVRIRVTDYTTLVFPPPPTLPPLQ